MTLLDSHLPVTERSIVAAEVVGDGASDHRHNGAIAHGLAIAEAVPKSAKIRLRNSCSGRLSQTGVVFADVVDSTSMTELLGPVQMAQLIVEFSEIVNDIVVRNGGVVHQFRGDSAIAYFETDAGRPAAAINTLRCARELEVAFEAWCVRRLAEGACAVSVGVGAHFGPVLRFQRNINDLTSQELAGEVMNTASRLEHVTREIGSLLVISNDLVERARRFPSANSLLAGLEFLGPYPLRGCSKPLSIWSLCRKGTR